MAALCRRIAPLCSIAARAESMPVGAVFLFPSFYRRPRLRFVLVPGKGEAVLLLLALPWLLTIVSIALRCIESGGTTYLYTIENRAVLCFISGRGG